MSEIAERTLFRFEKYLKLKLCIKKTTYYQQCKRKKTINGTIHDDEKGTWR